MLRRINKSALKFLAPQILPETYRTAVREAINLTQADYGTIYLAHRGVLESVYTSVPVSFRTDPRKHGTTYRTFYSKKVMVVSAQKLKKDQPHLIENGIKSVVLIPLAHHKQPLGVLTLLSKRASHFTKDRLTALKVFGSLISLAIQKNQFVAEAKAALRTRDLFISMAAHELRTPATTIQGYAQLMKRKNLKKENIPHKWIEIIAAETLRLNSLLAELLQVDQIKTGQLNYALKNNSLRGIIKRTIEASKINHPKHKIIFEDKLNGFNDTLYSDFDKLLQSIINLVNNSAKFSPPNSQIKIILSYQKPYFKIAVIDQGRGISKRDLPHIFEGFYKGKNNTREGMGLGLFLAENIVQRHNGFISLNSTIGKGTIAQINLPIG